VTVIARLLLFWLLIFSAQAWSLGIVQGENYGYDGPLSAHIKQSELLRFKNTVYNAFSDFPDITENQFPASSNTRLGEGLFFASLSDFVVTKSAVQNFDIAPRVLKQLNDSRLGSLAGKLSPNDLQKLANNPSARRFLDGRSGNINVIQEVEGKLLRITTPRDAQKIISVGPIRPNQVTNRINSGDFVPLK